MQTISRFSRIASRSIRLSNSMNTCRSLAFKTVPIKNASHMNKLITLGSLGVVSMIGVSSFAFAQDKDVSESNIVDSHIEEEPKKKEPLPLEPPPTFTLEDDEDDDDPELKEYNPWFRGVKEISIFLNKESINSLNDQFPQLFGTRHADRVTLVLNPKDEESNSYAMFMQEDTPIKVIGMVQDKHVTVLMVDLPNIRSLYEYPCIVLECEGNDDTHAYSEAYGRLLLDRAFKGGMFSMENNHYILKEHTKTQVLEDYYTYPETEVTGIDLREKNIELKGTVCTGRGWDNKECKCNEPVHKAECGWCVFMKGGPCWREFTKWQKCIAKCGQDASTDEFISKCGMSTLHLKECVDANPQYYGEMAQSNDNNENKEEKIIEVDPNEGKDNEHVAETPVVETPIVETSVAEAPVAETSVTETPVVETPVVETPVVTAPIIMLSQNEEASSLIEDDTYEESLRKDMDM